MTTEPAFGVEDGQTPEAGHLTPPGHISGGLALGLQRTGFVVGVVVSAGGTAVRQRCSRGCWLLLLLLLLPFACALISWPAGPRFQARSKTPVPAHSVQLLAFLVERQLSPLGKTQRSSKAPTGAVLVRCSYQC